jgi:hypothetical protein
MHSMRMHMLAVAALGLWCCARRLQDMRIVTWKQRQPAQALWHYSCSLLIPPVPFNCGVLLC